MLKSENKDLDQKLFRRVLKNVVRYIFINFKKFFNIDKFIKNLGTKTNVNIMSLLDCCRELKTKGREVFSAAEIAERKKKGIVDKIETQYRGMATTFYAKADGSLADAGSETSMLSPTTQAFIYFLMANPGAIYPNVMLEFQWGVLNRCDLQMCSTRGIQFVEGLPKNWTNQEFVQTLTDKIVQTFPKEIFSDFHVELPEVMRDTLKFDEVLFDRY